MKVLVINCGSSSLKYQLINMENEASLATGLVERIAIEGSKLTQKVDGREKYVLTVPMKNHKEAISHVINTLLDDVQGVIKSSDEISAVGHRVVHGGEKYSASVIITDEVMKDLEEFSQLAPLHNPPNIIGINACKELMPNTPMVAVFDTAFHQTMPEKAFLYGLPYELYKENHIRKYGFHGTSHKYVSQRAAEILGEDIKGLKLVTCHLGNGSSVAAVNGGISVDTSMGFTPLEGLLMGTRCGDIDPAIIPYLMDVKGYSYEEVNNIMNKKSGVLGLSGVSSDFRDIEDAAAEGNERAKLALDVFHYRVKKYIGYFMAAMNGVDAIIFTAGLGENAAETREEIIADMEWFGIKMDKEKNKVRGQERIVSTDDSKVKIIIIPTNEELMIARDTLTLLK
ncbi:MAG TPA: acetate kinase [Proteiniclasticum sp.]|uniref:Acetate kinase n=1 Tax=Proteiniclasticum ruminis TaxID=398199 RepID=A0A1I4YF94_9CLOT|nr:MULTISPECIES: acetate kinase [Proteiniclasticum]SFN36662.1 acetate kinase [Proteiniclasticum ruminis]HBW12458.1 acetate kinase [Proteiniclasticum sp.]